MGYTTLEALKSYGSFEEDDNDELLYAMIGSATAVIENHTQRRFEIDDETDQTFSKLNLPEESRFNGSMLYFYEELAEEASAITDSPTVIYIPEDGPPYYGIRKTDGSWAYPTVTVTGYWGYSKTPPPDIELACLKLAKWFYDQKDTSQSDALVITPEGRVLLPKGLPSDVKALLAPYVKVITA